MSLTKEDKTWIKEVIGGVETSLREELKDTETSLRADILYNRKLVNDIREDVSEMKEEMHKLNDARMEDDDASLEEVAKISSAVKSLTGRVAKLEAQS